MKHCLFSVLQIRLVLLLMMAGLVFCSACSKREKTTVPDERKNGSRASGVSAAKEPPSKGITNPGIALVLVDVQHDFFDAPTEMANPNFVANLKSALKTCRENGIEVIHVRTAFSANPNDRPSGFRKFFGSKIPCVIGTPGIKPLECARQVQGEKVFYKDSYDPFEKDGLNEHLQSKKIGQVFVCGLTTDVCVLSTCFSATNKGYLTTLVEDCTATQNPMSHQFVVNRYQGMLFETIKSSEIKARFTQRFEGPRPTTIRNVPASTIPADQR